VLKIEAPVYNFLAAQAQQNEEPEIMEKYKSMHERYQDVAGFLSIPNTGVSYYVFQGEDDEYYLHHNRDGKKSVSGEIYLDYRCSMEQLKRHLIIYGHNMRHNSMFGSLDKYKKRDFYLENPAFTFNTIYGDYMWEVFSVRIVNVDETGSTIIQTQFDTDEKWLSYITDIQKGSLYSIPLTLNKDDVVLTLMTCSYEYENGRLLVHARLVKEKT